MTDPDVEAKAIVAGLTENQRALISDETQHLPQHEAVLLADKGLAHTFIARGGRYFGLTDLGRAVRKHLLESQSHDKGEAM